MEGIVSYSNEAKMHSLNVPKEMLDEHGAVSSQVAEAMATGARERAKTDFAISVTGVAGPGGGSEEKPVGLVYFGIADESGVEHRKFIFPGDRFLIRWRSSQAALDLLRRKLLQNK
jgi:nicotinamide-nucleotide amidase